MEFISLDRPMIPKRLSASERIVAWRLATGRIISKLEFQDYLCGVSRPFPNTADKVVQVRIRAVRQAARGLGIDIRNFYGAGYVVEPEQFGFGSVLSSWIKVTFFLPN